MMPPVGAMQGIAAFSQRGQSGGGGVTDLLEDFSSLMDTEWKLLVSVIMLTLSGVYSFVCFLLVSSRESRAPSRARVPTPITPTHGAWLIACADRADTTRRLGVVAPGAVPLPARLRIDAGLARRAAADALAHHARLGAAGARREVLLRIQDAGAALVDVEAEIRLANQAQRMMASGRPRFAGDGRDHGRPQPALCALPLLFCVRRIFWVRYERQSD